MVIIKLIILKTIDPIIAPNNPAILNPGTIPAVSFNIIPLITSVNSPKVNILIGSVKIKNTGFTIVFAIPKITADHSAVINPEM
ncbi:MAG: hypothetical protein PWQ37_2469 [Candidatus Petromonas sp.]|nr:hypothetical protein [Candidatus Petromonas sp.]